jgi:glycosyltransferase involved in cell wall biosynthesis
VKLAVVVQRYGQAINGGAELHARYIAEHLARHAEVEVLTTCATDYVTWRNELAPGVERVNGVAVRRFRVKHERNPLKFGLDSGRVFARAHSLAQELAWLDAEGPASPALVAYLRRNAASYDFCIFFSYRYYHAYHGVRAVPTRAVLVPTAERDAAIGLSIFQPMFRGVRALMYNSHEERAMIHAASGNQQVPGVVVGIGSDVPQNPQPGRFRQKFDIRGRFAVYVGRIDENKGCKELFDFFDGYLQDGSGRLSLVLIGNSLLTIPTHPRIRHLGFLDDADKFDAMAAADLLIMPSYFESLSMVALEAWALGRPVLANGRCDVLKGQCIRSNAGLFYESCREFAETLQAIEQNSWLASSLGRNGREFFREQYDWPVIERKYVDMLARLSKEAPPRAIDPLPGWFARRRQDQPAAEHVLARLPAGPALGRDSSAGGGQATSAPPAGSRDARKRA